MPDYLANAQAVEGHLLAWSDEHGGDLTADEAAIVIRMLELVRRENRLPKET
ncbi:MAG: hypothetical protein ABI862_14930 [Ilumatobacteraceae bacterium]